MVDVSQLSMIKYVADADTPNNLQQYHGLVVGIPPDLPAQLPTTEDGRTNLYGVFGYARTGAEGLEWVMTDRVGRAFRQALNNVPGTDGWHDLAARQAVRQVARELLSRGFTEVDALSVVQRIHDAARTETLARGVT